MRYLTNIVSFSEVPDEISLCIGITGCTIHCPDWNQKELWEDVGTELTWETLDKLIHDNEGITCVCFMGGELHDVRKLAIKVKELGLKTCWYTGYSKIPNNVEGLDYMKIGPYNKELGGLDSKDTNQRFYQINKESFGYTMTNITHLFRRKTC